MDKGKYRQVLRIVIRGRDRKYLKFFNKLRIQKNFKINQTLYFLIRYYYVNEKKRKERLKQLESKLKKFEDQNGHNR